MSKKIKKVCIFTGTRAEYGILYWLISDIAGDKDLTLQILASGTHFSPEFGETYKEIEADGFFINKKIEMLLSTNSPAGTAKSIGLGIIGFTDALTSLKPDMLIVLGDRFEALAAAQTAMILRIPVFHLHGGEITQGAYDESIRHAITKLSYLHGTSTDEYRKRVIQLGEAPSRVKNVGAMGLDHIKRSKLMTLKELEQSLKFKLTEKFFIVTYHPVTIGDEDAAKSFKALLKALKDFKEYKILITYPNADDGGRAIIPLIENYVINNASRVKSIPSLGQKRYLSAIKYSSCVIGNSSSGIIEVPSFDVPTVNIGVRQKGRLSAKSVINAKPTSIEIAAAIDYALNKHYKLDGEPITNPYGQGDASSQVINMIKTSSYEQYKIFFDLEPQL